MLTLDQIKQLKEIKPEDLEELKESVVELVEAEKQTGINAAKNKGKETEKFRNALKKIGYNHEKHESVDGFLSEFERKQSVTNEKLTDMQTVQKALSETRIELSELKDELKGERTQGIRTKAESGLMEKLGGQIYGAKSIIGGILERNEFQKSEDGEGVLIKSGEDFVSLEDFAKSYVKDNPDDVRVSQVPGKGDRPDENGNIGDPSSVATEIAKAMGVKP